MSNENLQIKSEEIAKMLGWFQFAAQPYFWYKKTESAPVVAYSTYGKPLMELPFFKDWNYLMQVKAFIEDSGEYNVVISGNSCYIANRDTGNTVCKSLFIEKDCIISTFNVFYEFAVMYNQNN